MDNLELMRIFCIKSDDIKAQVGCNHYFIFSVLDDELHQ